MVGGSFLASENMVIRRTPMRLSSKGSLSGAGSPDMLVDVGRKKNGNATSEPARFPTATADQNLAFNRL